MTTTELVNRFRLMGIVADEVYYKEYEIGLVWTATEVYSIKRGVVKKLEVTIPDKYPQSNVVLGSNFYWKPWNSYVWGGLQKMVGGIVFTCCYFPKTDKVVFIDIAYSPKYMVYVRNDMIIWATEVDSYNESGIVNVIIYKDDLIYAKDTFGVDTALIDKVWERTVYNAELVEKLKPTILAAEEYTEQEARLIPYSLTLIGFTANFVLFIRKSGRMQNSWVLFNRKTGKFLFMRLSGYDYKQRRTQWLFCEKYMYANFDCCRLPGRPPIFKAVRFKQNGSIDIGESTCVDSNGRMGKYARAVAFCLSNYNQKSVVVDYVYASLENAEHPSPQYAYLISNNTAQKEWQVLNQGTNHLIEMTYGAKYLLY